MDSFEHLKKVWQQQVVPVKQVDVAELRKNNIDHQRKLEQTQLLSAIALLITSVAIIWIGFFSSIHFQSTLTYIAVVLIAILPAIQGVINLSLYRRLHRIDITLPVADHLDQWERYYSFRKRLLRVNMPIYYLLLSGALSLYFIEILGLMPLLWRIVALIVYTGWMLFAYFVLGRKTLRKEQERLEAIIRNLGVIQKQVHRSDDLGE